MLHRAWSRRQVPEIAHTDFAVLGRTRRRENPSASRHYTADHAEHYRPHGRSAVDGTESSEPAMSSGCSSTVPVTFEPKMWVRLALALRTAGSIGSSSGMATCRARCRWCCGTAAPTAAAPWGSVIAGTFTVLCSDPDSGTSPGVLVPERDGRRRRAGRGSPRSRTRRRDGAGVPQPESVVAVMMMTEILFLQARSVTVER